MSDIVETVIWTRQVKSVCGLFPQLCLYELAVEQKLSVIERKRLYMGGWNNHNHIKFVLFGNHFDLYPKVPNLFFINRE